jgi:hypothetical protein
MGDWTLACLEALCSYVWTAVLADYSRTKNSEDLLAPNPGFLYVPGSTMTLTSPFVRTALVSLLSCVQDFREPFRANHS